MALAVPPSHAREFGAGRELRCHPALLLRMVDEMQSPVVARAVTAAMPIASSFDLIVDDAIVLHDSNKLTLRLLPCDVLARVAPAAHQIAQQLVASRDRTPALAEADRRLLGDTLQSLRRVIGERGSTQVLHGEPHPINVLSTRNGAGALLEGPLIKHHTAVATPDLSRSTARKRAGNFRTR